MKRLATIGVTVQEMNSILKDTDTCSKQYHPCSQTEYSYSTAYIVDKTVTLEVTTRYKGKFATYICRKDDKEYLTGINGADAYIQASRAYHTATGSKLPEWEIRESALAYLMYREDGNKTRVRAYGYDMNAAYGWGLCQPMPDTRALLREHSIVKAGEIGFAVIDEPYVPDGYYMMTRSALVMVSEGEYADWIFPSMESPFKKFVALWYGRKLADKNDTEKMKAKNMVNFAVGYLQRKNPFLRAAAIGHCNNRILSLIDEHTLYCNTDCIVSSEPRPDLTIGTGLGEFKVEHDGYFAHVGYNTQWNNDIPSYRGIPKSWFKKGFDILTDSVPSCDNKYIFDRYTNRLLRREEYEKQRLEREQEVYEINGEECRVCEEDDCEEYLG